MAFVIAEPCVGCCDAACVSVCPVDCIHGPVDPAELERLPTEQRQEKVKGLQLFIDPSTCIDCGACAPACPVDAIFDEHELPAKWARFVELNANWFRRRITD